MSSGLLPFPTALHDSAHNEYGTPPEVVAAARSLMGGIDLDPASDELFNLGVAADHYFDEEANGFLFAWDLALFPTRRSKPGNASRVFLNPPGGYQDADGRRVVRAFKLPSGARVERCELSGSCGQKPGHVHRAPTRSAAKEWWRKLVREWQAGRVEQAVFVGFNVDILQTTQVSPAGEPCPSCLEFPICVPHHRLKFLVDASDSEEPRLEPAAQPPGSSVIVWLPPSDVQAGLMLHELVARMSKAFGKIGACR